MISTQVAFIIPFAPKAVKSNWREASEHLRQTIGSVLNSTNRDFTITVVGHEPPDFDLPKDSRFKFISISHNRQPHSTDDRQRSVRDKLMKISVGWQHVTSTSQPRFVMKLDADDLISMHLVDFAAKSDGSTDGILISSGYLWRTQARRIIQATNKFDRLCGSCLILRREAADLTGPFLNSIDGFDVDHYFEASNPSSLVPGAGEGSLLLNDSHTRIRAQFDHLGLKLGMVPFRGAVYRIGNSDSMWKVNDKIHTLRMALGKLKMLRPITDSIRRDFNLIARK